ncbi:MAG: hypothetical protein JXA15_06375 [Spirochaetales bacterium]|nr:hypothetical protein [Spirochaetales bacterium]
MWEERAIPERGTLAWRFSERTVFLRASGSGVEVAEDASAGAGAGTVAVTRASPAGLSWRRIALGRKPELARLSPRVPEKPWLVLFSPALELAPRTATAGWIRAPLSADLVVDGLPLLRELGLCARKTAWFGSPQNGLLCLAAGSAFTESPSAAPGAIALPLAVRNDTAERVELARLCVYGDSVGAWGREDGPLVIGDSLECTVSDAGTRVSTRHGRPRPELAGPDTVELAAPRQNAQDRFFARSVELLKVIAGM